MIIPLFFVLMICAGTHSEQLDENEPIVHTKPYSFAFTAGRYPGNVDRTRAEFGDDNGIIRGLYTYIDPRHEIRAVQYTADKEGFHPVLNIPGAKETPAVAAARSRHIQLFNKIASRNIIYPKETEAVAKAKQNHAILYEQIAQQHAQIAAELEAARIEAEREKLNENQY